MKLQGSIVALITPFHADGTVNFERLGEILDWHVAQEPTVFWCWALQGNLPP